MALDSLNILLPWIDALGAAGDENCATMAIFCLGFFGGGGIGSVLSGVGSIVGGVLGAGASIFGANRAAEGAASANEMSAWEAERNRQWQEYMSSTAHQREVDDLRKAGLNPILSAFNTGASTPKGGQASFENPYASSTEAAAGVNSALRMMTLENERLQMEKNLSAASADRERSQTELNKENIPVLAETTKELQTRQAANSAQAIKSIQETSTSEALSRMYTAGAAREMTQASLNSALEQKTRVLTQLSSIEAYIQEHSKEFEKWRRLIDKGIETTGKGAGIIGGIIGATKFGGLLRDIKIIKGLLE